MAEKVEAFPVEVDEAYRVFEWRCAQLEQAGFSEAQATLLALNREVDLHQACELCRKAGADSAYRILS